MNKSYINNTYRSILIIAFEATKLKYKFKNVLVAFFISPVNFLKN